MKWEPEILARNPPVEGQGCGTRSFHHTAMGELLGCTCPTFKHELELAWASLFFLQPRPSPSLQSSSPGEGGSLPSELAAKSRRLMAPLTTSHGPMWVRRGQGQGEGTIPRSVSIAANPGQVMGTQLGCVSFFRGRGTWLVMQEPAAFSPPGALQKELLCGTLRAMSATPPGSLSIRHRPTRGAPSQNLEQLQELAVVRMSPGSSLKN